jgi:hypothetical protein
MKFDNKSFKKMAFTNEQISKYFLSAEKCLRIAEAVKIPEVVFKFSYDALLKLGITLIAQGGHKVRVMAGHHIKILEKTAEILNNKTIASIGNMMRTQRNFDLYDAGTIVSKKQSEEYLEFVQRTFKQAKKLLYE